MALSPSLVARLDLGAAVRLELAASNRLLPTRIDNLVLGTQPDKVANWIEPQLRQRDERTRADVVFADKDWRGARPLSVMTLRDRVLLRALVSLISQGLPPDVRSRSPIASFKSAPLAVESTQFVAVTDVASYYEFVDHGILADELIAQTGEEPAVRTLVPHLRSVMGREVGLPQVHPSSDILGDTYIDRARRQLLRSGLRVFTYSDDFRIATTSLGGARKALEQCSAVVRDLGLALNERKTYTYGIDRYRASLESFAETERKLFEDAEHSEGMFQLLGRGYGGAADPTQLDISALEPRLGGGVDDVDAIGDPAETRSPAEETTAEHAAEAARRAWLLWVREDEAEAVQSAQTAAITQSLLAKALPTLGANGDDAPLQSLNALLGLEPALSPEIAGYLVSFGRDNAERSAAVWVALDAAVSGDLLSAWQGIWLAHAAGALAPPGDTARPSVSWLRSCVESAPPGLAATSTSALARLQLGYRDPMLSAVDRVGPAWRRLVIWSLGLLDTRAALDAADDALDRFLADPGAS